MARRWGERTGQREAQAAGARSTLGLDSLAAFAAHISWKHFLWASVSDGGWSHLAGREVT